MTTVYVDTETTGIDPRVHDAWEVAAIVQDHPDGLDGEYVWVLHVDTTNADPDALRIGRYAERHDPATITPRVLADTLARLTDDATLVGVNPQFDAAFLGKILRTAGIEPGWSYRLLDLPSMALGYLAALGRPAPRNTSSGALSRLCGFPEPTAAARHTALGDARWARGWHRTMTTTRGLYDEIPPPVKETT